MSTITDEEYQEIRKALAERRARKEEASRPKVGVGSLPGVIEAAEHNKAGSMVRVRDGAIVYQPGSGANSAALYKPHPDIPETAFGKNVSLRGQNVPLHLEPMELFGMVNDLKAQIAELQSQIVSLQNDIAGPKPSGPMCIHGIPFSEHCRACMRTLAATKEEG